MSWHSFLSVLFVFVLVFCLCFCNYLCLGISVILSYFYLSFSLSLSLSTGQTQIRICIFPGVSVFVLSSCHGVCIFLHWVLKKIMIGHNMIIWFKWFVLLCLTDLAHKTLQWATSLILQNLKYRKYSILAKITESKNSNSQFFHRGHLILPSIGNPEWRRNFTQHL